MMRYVRYLPAGQDGWECVDDTGWVTNDAGPR